MDDTDDEIHEVDCPGAPACPHAPGHKHLEVGCCGQGQVWSSDGELLDPYDLTRPALIPIVTPLQSSPRWRGRRRE